MHARRRVYGAGAVLTAAAAVVLSGSPAQAACSTDNTQKWQVGAQLGHAPVELTGTGGPLAALVSILPVSGIAVEDATTGENLVRVDAASVRTRTESPALPDDLDLVGPVRGVKVTEATDRVRTSEAGTRTAVGRAAQPAGQVDAAAVPAPEQIPLRADGADNLLAGPLNWVPIESIGLFGQDGDGVPWASGLALMVLGAGVAGVTVVARRARLGA